jgi:hypothetical protein
MGQMDAMTLELYSGFGPHVSFALSDALRVARPIDTTTRE